ncbi:MAG: 50S ribosomal protein L29 [Hyphomonadaceae bacterium]|nr:50S ribosomal protein L29 [Hyphomonadaceae bacterium]
MKLRDIRKELGELRGSDAAKVGEELVAMKKEQFNLRFQQATGQLEKSSRMRDVRRMVARAKTVLREKSTKAKV